MSNTVLFMNGIFNIIDPIFGWQLYIWGWVLIIFFAICAHIIWYYAKWKPFTPLHGLYYAFKAGSNVAFVFDANLIGEMVAEREAKCIFDYSTWDYELPGVSGWFRKWVFYYPTAFLDDISPLHALVYKYGHVNKDVQIARHLQNGEWERSPSAVCGGVPLDIVIDTDNWTIRTSPQHKAIERVTQAWNDLNPTDQIHSYSKFQRYLLLGHIQCPEVKQNTFVSWTRIDAGFPLDLEENEWAGKRRQMAEQEFNEDQQNMNRLGWGVLLGGLGFAVLMIMVRLIIHFVK